MAKFDHLPYEIIVAIMTILNDNDKWNLASCSNMMLTVYLTSFNLKLFPMGSSYLLKSCVKTIRTNTFIKKLSLMRINTHLVNKFFLVTNLTIDHPDFNISEFIDVYASRFTHLRDLKINIRGFVNYHAFTKNMRNIYTTIHSHIYSNSFFHFSSLQYLFLDCSNMAICSWSDKLVITNTNLTSLNINYHHQVNHLCFYFPNLENIQIKINVNQLHMIQTIIDEHPNLTKLHLCINNKHMRLNDDSQLPIILRSDKIKEFTIMDKTSFHQEDINIFEDLQLDFPELTNLQIESDSCEVTENMSFCFPKLTKLNLYGRFNHLHFHSSTLSFLRIKQTKFSKVIHLHGIIPHLSQFEISGMFRTNLASIATKKLIILDNPMKTKESMNYHCDFLPLQIE